MTGNWSGGGTVTLSSVKNSEAVDLS